MYLDTDVVLALVKEEDWLESEFDADQLVNPKTSVITLVEIQLVYFDSRSKEFLSSVAEMVRDQNIRVLDFEEDVFERSSELIEKYEKLNVFDSIHLAQAEKLGEPIISTDTLYPEIEEVENTDPREL